MVHLCRCPHLFQSTLLMRGATSARSSLACIIRFQSTLLMRGATRTIIWRSEWDSFQSTLLMRGATLVIDLKRYITLISIHAPHARSDHTVPNEGNRTVRFQSTLLMRGATCAREVYRVECLNFNPRSSCEERRTVYQHIQLCQNFNPRSSCEERQYLLWLDA